MKLKKKQEKNAIVTYKNKTKKTSSLGLGMPKFPKPDFFI
jgi:hypothetical protein